MTVDPDSRDHIGRAMGSSATDAEPGGHAAMNRLSVPPEGRRSAVSSHHQDIGRITLTVLFIGGLLAASLWIIQPFLPAFLWATALVLPTWPLMLWIERHTGGRRSIAVLIMTLAVLLVLFVPLWLAVSTVLSNTDVIKGTIYTVLSLPVPPPPPWVVEIPLVGAGIGGAWTKLQASGLQELGPKLTPYAAEATRRIVYMAGDLGEIFIHFLLTTLIAAVLYAWGEQAADKALLFGRRLAGERGERAIFLAGQAIRSVALGVVITALVQSAIGGIGLVVAGVPFAGLLTALMFFLCLIQLGPGFVLVPAIIWMYYSGHVLGATALLVLSLIAMVIDQFLRPALIKRGADLPFLLILAGVLGGLFAFGMLGIFIGPTVLAVAYTLLNAWMAEALKRDDRSDLATSP